MRLRTNHGYRWETSTSKVLKVVLRFFRMQLNVPTSLLRVHRHHHIIQPCQKKIQCVPFKINQLVVEIASIDLGHVVSDHVTDEVREVDGADPAKDCLRLGGIAEKLLDLGGAEVRGVHLDEDPERRRKRDGGKSQKIV